MLKPGYQPKGPGGPTGTPPNAGSSVRPPDAQIVALAAGAGDGSPWLTVAKLLRALFGRVGALEAAAPAAGLPGADGIPGTDGRDGIDGQDGVPGADGKDGAPGKDGRDGIDGKDGPPGRDGTDGVNGRDGAPGLRGDAGRDGRDGKDGRWLARAWIEDGVLRGVYSDGVAAEFGAVVGPPGRDGVDGRNGQDGQDGAPGAPGVDGNAGVPGRDGRPGASVKGDPGAPGTPGTPVELGSTDLARLTAADLPRLQVTELTIDGQPVRVLTLA